MQGRRAVAALEQVFRRATARASSGPPPAATMQALREHFAPWDERLAARLGRRLDWMAG
ncbi:MAG: hypothetical protein U1F43_19475 [Myxococcota bacterium]